MASTSIISSFLFVVLTFPSSKTATPKPTTTTTTITAIPTECKGLSKPENGQISSTPLSANSTANFSCYSGYRLNGNTTLTCLPSGHWDAESPKCEVINCTNPPHTENGQVNFTSLSANSTATYSCNSGYSLNGAAKLKCLAKGEWDADSPKCELVITQINESCETDEQCSAATPNASCINAACQCNRSRFYMDNECVLRPNLPEQQFEIIYIKTHEFTVNWTPLKLLPDETVTFKLDPPDGDPVPNEFEGAFFRVNNLRSGTNYTVNLYVIKNGIPSFDSQVQTTYTKPEGPTYTGASISDIREHNFTVILTSDPERPCENYTLKISKPDSYEREVNISRQVNITSYPFKNLTGGVNYTVIIYSVAGRFISEGSITLSSFTRPPKISEVEITEQHNTSFELSINYTGEGEQHINYCIYVQPPINTRALQSGETVCECCLENSNETYSVFCTDSSKDTISGLTPGTNYSLDIYSCIDGLKSEMPYSLTTATRPSDPSIIISDISETSLRVECLFNADDSTTDIVLKIETPHSGSYNVTIERNGTLSLEFLFENLTAGTKYTIFAYSFTGNLGSETAVTLYSYTRPLPTNVTHIEQFENSLQLSVDRSVHFNMMHIIVKHDGGLIQNLTHSAHNASSSAIKVTNLTSGTNYNLTLITMIDSLESLQSTNVSSFTKPGPPENVSFPVHDLHENSFKVKIIPPSEGSYDDFCLVLRNQNENETVNSTCVTATSSANTEVTYTDLSAGVKYDVSVLTRWQNENSTVFPYSQRTRPDPPEKVTISDIEVNSLTINFTKKWNAYSFVFEPPLNDSDTNLIVSKIPWTIPKLETGTKYNISIYSIEENISSERSTTKISYTRPGNVTTISGVPEKTSESVLTLQWKNPVGDFDLFNISAFCESPNKDSNRSQNIYAETNTTTTYFELDAGTICNVSINVVIFNVDEDNKVLEGDTVQRKDIRTNEAAPQGVIIGNETAVDARSLYVQWQKPDNPNGIVRNYRIMIIDLLHNCSKEKTFPKIESKPDSYSCTDIKSNTYTPCAADEQIMHIELETEPLSASVSGLHPYRNYSVNIQAYTKCWGETKKLINQTDEAAPEAPPSPEIIGYTKDKIKIKWTPPSEEDANGVIKKYTIYFEWKNKTCWNSEDGEIVEQNISYSKSDMSYTLSHLRPYWYYNITMSASTSEGEGPYGWCDGCYLRTNESTPGDIEHLTVNTSAESADLNWSPPCRTNGIITKYTINIRNIDTNESWTNDTSSNETIHTIMNLLPYSNYTITIAANTKKGPGKFAKETSRRTKIAKPRMPIDPKAITKNATSLNVTWKTPNLYTGPTKYTVTVMDLTNMTIKIKRCEFDFNATECIVTGLDEYWNYNITVIATTDAGNTSSITVTGQTAEARPGNIRRLSLKSEDDVTKNRSVEVTWTPPKDRDKNGIIQRYYIEFKDNDGKTVSFDTKDNITTHYFYQGMFPGVYSVQVFAATTVGNGTVVTQSITVRPGAPLKLIEETADSLLMQPSKAKLSDDERQIAVKLPLKDLLCNIRNGQLKRWGVVVAQENQATDTSFTGSTVDFNNKVKEKYKSWFQVKDMDDIPPYIATPENWTLQCPTFYSSNRRKRAATTATPEQDFIVGEDGKCSGKQNNKYCNGELQPGRSYRVKTFVCTAGGCTETEYSKAISTAPDLTVPMAAGISSALVVIAVIAVVVFVLRRKQLVCFAKDDESLRTHTPGEGIHMDKIETTKKNAFSVLGQGPIKLSDFPDAVEKMHKDSDLLFADAYKMLKEKSPNHPMTAAEQQCCRPKNRYTNILPFDHSRVKLRPSDDMEGSDYINANYIPGYTSRREYIATQGAMQATFDDFWRMIWEQNVDTIVMLTKLMEKGRHKCDKYWPDLGEPVFYGDLVVSLQSESNLSDYTIKIFEVKMGTKMKKIKHFHFLQWPDFGCPDKHWPVINFISMVRQYRPPFPKGPLLVHCSAGVGRTGTFIAVDYLLQHIRDHDEVDIFSLVLEMRNHRLNMVQTEDQYVYIHECLKAFITTDEEEEDEDEDEHVYVNTSFGAQEENIYENSGYQKD